MNPSPSAAEALQAAVDALNGGDPVTAANIALQVLSKQPQNQDAMTVLGAARFAALCNPHDTFFAKLQSFGFAPRMAIDIGAYEGHWTAALKRRFPQTEVLMIEAQTGKADALGAVCENHSGVDHRICLAGDRNDDAVDFHVMDTPYGSTGSSMYPEQTSFPRDAVSLTMRRLDDILADAGTGAPDLLKIDVQGAELDVLAGATKALETVELIHMELSVLQYNVGAPLIAEVLPALDAAGFVLFDVLEEHRIGQGALSQLDALFIRKNSPLRPAGVLF